jgi:hypothetical protein
MKVAEASVIAMPWAASAVVPTQPIMTAEAEKRPTSARFVSPIGQPRRKTRAKACGSARQKRWKRAYSGVAALV